MSESTSVSEDLGDGGEIAPAADTPDAPPSIRDTLEATFDAVQAGEPLEPFLISASPDRARGPDGKYVSKPAEAPPATALVEPAPAPAPLDAIPPPEGWADKAKVDWNRLPASVKAEIAARATPQADPLRSVINEFQQDIAAVGAQPEQMVRNLFNAERMLRDPATREEAFRYLANTYRFDLSRLAPPQSAAQPQQAGVPADPQLQAVYAELNALKAELQETRGQTEAQRQDALQRREAEARQEIDGFKEGRSHFEAVRQDMSLLIQHNPSLDLAAAYDRAVWANPSTRAALLQEQRTAEEATRAKDAAARAAAARKAGSINVRGTPGSTPAAPTSMRETLAASYDAIHGAA